MAFAKPLPIDEFQDTIVGLVEKNPVLILTAETGAGKSTRVPCWFWKRGRRVHVTQPRRIATRSLAHWLAQEHGLTLGNEIGYQTGFETRKSAKTRLLYLTDGVQMVQEIRNRRDYDMLILDEIHEWNLNQEVLVGLAKKLLDEGYWRRSGKRVLVMSATLRASQISTFFNHAPVVTVPGRGHPVSSHFHSPLFLLPDVAQLVEEKRNILVFQPGKQEIEEFSASLKRMLDEEKTKAAIMPLYSELSLKDQSKVFDHFSVPKVVVATDIAQTSLTIDDIDAVVDCGVKKEVRVVNGIEGLYPVDIAGSECRQRAGRAGRVKPGVYILCAEREVEDRPEFAEPEIRRLSLETVLLRMLKWGLHPLEFPFYHRPKRNLVLAAIASLQVFGAITPDLEVTSDGMRMAELPVSIRSSRLLLEAEKGGPRVVERALKIIAISECKGIVSREYQGERYSSGPYLSDLLNQLALWEAAQKNRRSVSAKKMALAMEIYQELKRRLQVPLQRGTLSDKEQRCLFRAVLSSFVDGVYSRSDAGYCRGDELRQLDRTSIVALSEKKPEMVAGLPFDLSVSRTNSLTGRSEEIHLPLLTFCSELSFAQLDELAPFSYRKETEVRIGEGRLAVFEHRFIAGSLMKSVEKQADWRDVSERNLLVARALSWLEENLSRTILAPAAEKNRRWFAEALPLLPKRLKSFEHFWHAFLERELAENLRMQDLANFMASHSGWQGIRLDRLLPPALIRTLRRRRWPSQVQCAGKSMTIAWTEEGASIEVDRSDFEKMTSEDLLLPTGERAALLVSGRRYPDWQAAVADYNLWLKNEIFKKKWFFDRKRARVADLQEIPFPVSFIGGRGMDNAAFEFYSVPILEKDEVYLIHFIDRAEAEAAFARNRERWEAAKSHFKKEKLDSLFRAKGWRVK